MRIFFIILLTLLLIPALILTGVLGTANRIITESFISSSLRDIIDTVDLSDILVENLGDGDEGGEDREEGEGEDREEGEPDLLAIIVPHLNLDEILGDVSETLVHQAFGYLTGDTDSIVLSVDLSPIVQQVEDLFMNKDFFLEQVAEFDPEEYEQLKDLPDEELREFQEEVFADISGEMDFGLEEFDLIAMLAEDDSETLDVLSGIRDAYGKMKPAMFIAAGACLILIAIMILIKPVGGLIAAGVALILNGGLFALVPTVFNAMSNTILSALAEDEGAEIAELVKTLFSRVLAVPRNIGLIYLGLALAFIIAAIVIKKVKTKKA